MRMLRNESSDKKQYERYVKRLGAENVPKTFDKFRDLKYNDVEKWLDLKYYYRNIDERPIAYVKIDRELDKLGIHKGKAYPANDGIKAFIMPDTESRREQNHIWLRMKERSITDDEVRAYKDKALFSLHQWSGRRIRYCSVDGVSVISNVGEDKWVYKTAWKKEDFDDEVTNVMEVYKQYVK